MLLCVCVCVCVCTQSLLRLLKKLGLLGVLGSCEPRAVWLWDTDEWDPCWMNQEALDR